MSNPGIPATQLPAPANDSAVGSASAGPPDLAGLLPHMEGGLQRQMTVYDKIKEARGKASSMREQLDDLVKLGDMVETEDLVKSAAKLVSKGFGAAEIAGILSEAPEQGEQLKAWILQKDTVLRAQEQQLAAMAAATRHDMGVAGLRLLGAHSMAQLHGFGMEPQSSLSSPSSGASQAAGSANDLMAGGSPGSLPAAGPSDQNALGVPANG